MATPTFILPSAPTYTEGFVNGLNVYPDPTNFVANQVPFTRATTATRTNAAGLIELTPYNLLQYSEMFSQGVWGKTNSSITANTTIAPNGTFTADSLIEDNTNNAHILNLNTTSAFGTYTASIYAKPNGRNWMYLNLYAAANSGAWFDVQNGVVGVIQAGITTATITSVGNGWYRCTITGANAAVSPRVAAYTSSANNVSSYLGDGVSGLFLWGAQLVEGTNALPYQLTETRLNRPRVDFSLGGCPNLLLEPQRTNLMLRSEEFGSTTWSKIRSLVISDTTTSPSGLTNADTWQGDGSSGAKYVIQTASIVSGTTYTISIYAKKNTNNFIQLFGGAATFGANVWANFDLNNGVVGSIGSSTTASIQSVGNGWYRCIITGAATITTTGNAHVVGLITSATSPANEVNTLSTSVFLWGAQLEAGAFPTTYIPTSSASVTRNIDVAQLTGAQILIGQTEGTLYWEGTLTSGFDDIFYLNRSVTNSVFLYKNAINNIIFRIYYNNLFITITNATAYTGTVKIAASYKSGDSVLYINGVQVGTSSTAFAFTGDLADIVLNNTAYLFGNATKSVKSAAIYNTRLTNAELATLTTL